MNEHNEIKHTLSQLVYDGWNIFDILSVCQEMVEQEMAEFECMDCSINTAYTKQYYMIHNEMWEAINPVGKGMLCFDCVEKRLGTPLTIKDFTLAPVNAPHLTNPRFVNPTLDEGESV